MTVNSLLQLHASWDLGTLSALCLSNDKDDTCRYSLAKQLGIVSLSYEKDGFTLEPSLKYNIQKQQPHPVLAVSKKKGADTLKLSYDIDAESGTLEWVHNPYKVHSLALPVTRVCILMMLSQQFLR